MGESTDNIGGGILDQSEIDQLLAAAVAETRPPLIRADGKRIGETEEVRVESYDFRNPTFLTEVELRRLRILHEDFIRYLSARLAMFLHGVQLENGAFTDAVLRQVYRGSGVTLAYLFIQNGALGRGRIARR